MGNDNQDDPASQRRLRRREARGAAPTGAVMCFERGRIVKGVILQEHAISSRPSVGTMRFPKKASGEGV